MLKPVLENPWIQAAAVLLALVGVGVLAYLLSPVLIPLFAAFMLAYLLDPVVDYFENAEGKNWFFRWRVPRVRPSCARGGGASVAVEHSLVVDSSAHN